MKPKEALLYVLLICLAGILYVRFGKPLYKKYIDTSVEIDASSIGEPIPKYLYGQFIEHSGRCVYGGIWAEMLEDRKFFFEITGKGSGWSYIVTGRTSFQGDGNPFEALTGSPWQIIGDDKTVTMEQKGAFIGEHSPRIQLTDTGQPRGIYQGRLGLIKGKKYLGRIVLAGASEAAPVEVSLAWGEREDARATVVIDRLSADFVTHPFSFTSGSSTDNGRLDIVGKGKRFFKIGAVSLMPADNIHGMRADTLNLLIQLKSPVYRWPGGDFASGYNWKDGIGERDRRPPRKNPAWTGVESNDFGIHEYMTFCEEIGADPYIVINAGLGDAKSAAEEVEYLNGSVDTPMGKLRASNGHPKPFYAKLWGIGNEMWASWEIGHMPIDKFVNKHNQLVDAMRGVDPAIHIVAIGEPGEWSTKMLTHCADRMTSISEHIYFANKKDVIDHVLQIVYEIRYIISEYRRYRKDINALSGKDIRISFDEWNYWYGPFLYGEFGVRLYLKDALGIAAGLHEFFRNSDMVFMANYTQSVNAIGCINANKTAAVFATVCLVLQLYRNHFGLIPIEVNYAPDPLDVMAAWTEDKKAITVGIVNSDSRPVKFGLDLHGAELTGAGKLWIIEGKDPLLYNEAGRKPQVQIEEKSLSNFSGTFTSPPFSVSLYSLNVR